MLVLIERRVLSPKGPGTVAWPFFDAQFDVVRGISLPDTCLPWLRAEVTGNDTDPSDGSGGKAAAFCMHCDVEELGTAGMFLMRTLHIMLGNGCGYLK